MIRPKQTSHEGIAQLFAAEGDVVEGPPHPIPKYRAVHQLARDDPTRKFWVVFGVRGCVHSNSREENQATQHSPLRGLMKRR